MDIIVSAPAWGKIIEHIAAHLVFPGAPDMGNVLAHAGVRLDVGVGYAEGGGVYSADGTPIDRWGFGGVERALFGGGHTAAATHITVRSMHGDGLLVIAVRERYFDFPVPSAVTYHVWGLRLDERGAGRWERGAYARRYLARFETWAAALRGPEPTAEERRARLAQDLHAWRGALRAAMIECGVTGEAAIRGFDPRILDRSGPHYWMGGAVADVLRACGTDVVAVYQRVDALRDRWRRRYILRASREAGVAIAELDRERARARGRERAEGIGRALGFAYRRAEVAAAIADARRRHGRKDIDDLHDVERLDGGGQAVPYISICVGTRGRRSTQTCAAVAA